MDDLLINIIGMGNQGSAAGTASLKESSGTESKQKDFLSILTSIISGSDSQESLLNKLKEIQETGEPGLAYVMSSISSLLSSMVPPDAGKNTTDVVDQKLPGITENKAGQAEIDQATAFQKDTMRLLASMKGESELTIDKGKIPFTDTTGKMPVQNAIAMNLQQALLKEGHNADNDVIQASQNTSVASELLTLEILERNAGFLRAILEKGGQVNRQDGNNPGENKGFNGLLKPGEAMAQNTDNSPFLGEQEPDGREGEKPGDEVQSLILNAAKKYKEHVSGTNELKTNIDHETANVSSQKTTIEVPQGDSFRTNVFQVKDNNMTFEKGSFTSFVTDRIEKIVEQFSSRNSRMDMVVRLKLDDKETLLVSLRHEGQKVIVDVKASNDGLVNLLQAHKDEIARHLEDKNIFTNIFVQPDGEKNSERQNQRGNKKEDRKQEANTSFLSTLEATA
jgi:hypothetical protein